MVTLKESQYKKHIYTMYVLFFQILEILAIF